MEDIWFCIGWDGHLDLVVIYARSGYINAILVFAESDHEPFALGAGEVLTGDSSLDGYFDWPEVGVDASYLRRTGVFEAVFFSGGEDLLPVFLVEGEIEDGFGAFRGRRGVDEEIVLGQV